MELEGIMLSEISQVKKDKYQTNFIHMCKINEINKQIKLVELMNYLKS